MTKASYPFRNLVFQGGGMKMLAYHGVLQVLEERGVLDQIARVAGASSGSLTAMMVSLRLNAADTIDLFRGFEYSQIPALSRAGTEDEAAKNEDKATMAGEDQPLATAVDDSLLWDRLPGGELGQNFQNIVGNFQAITRLLNHHGWYANDNLYRWMGDVLAEHCGDRHATFRDLQAQGGRDLYVVATNLSRRKKEIFSAETTPDVAIADALLLSQSIPFYFEAPRFDGQRLGNGDIYTDGGILDNYPLQLFDEPRHASKSANFSDGVNWETLGCRFFTPAECEDRTAIATLVDYMMSVFLTLNAAEDVAYAVNPLAQQRTIEISDCCVDSTDFELEPDPDNVRYCELVESGRRATEEFLAGAAQ